MDPPVAAPWPGPSGCSRRGIGACCPPSVPDAASAWGCTCDCVCTWLCVAVLLRVAYGAASRRQLCGTDRAQRACATLPHSSQHWAGAGHGKEKERGSMGMAARAAATSGSFTALQRPGDCCNRSWCWCWRLRVHTHAHLRPAASVPTLGSQHGLEAGAARDGKGQGGWRVPAVWRGRPGARLPAGGGAAVARRGRGRMQVAQRGSGHSHEGGAAGGSVPAGEGGCTGRRRAG